MISAVIVCACARCSWSWHEMARHTYSGCFAFAANYRNVSSNCDDYTSDRKLARVSVTPWRRRVYILTVLNWNWTPVVNENLYSPEYTVA